MSQLSTLPTSLYGHLGSVLLAFGGGFLLVLASMRVGGPVAHAFTRYRDELNRDLRFIKHDLSANQVVLLQGLAVLGCLCAGLGLDNYLIVSAVPVVVIAPRFLVTRAKLNRITEIDSQIDTWLVVLANALRAVPSLGEAMETSARLVPRPLNEELELAMNNYSLGLPLDEALKTMRERLKSRTVSVALGALRVARNTGGNLPDTLETSAAALREIARLEGVVRTKTAEGKGQAAVIAVIPFPMIAILDYMNPELLSPLWTTNMGYLLLFIAFVLWLSAILWANKILKVDI